MKPVSDLQDSELRSELASFGCKIGPIAGTTRGFYEKKLETLRSGGSSVKQSKAGSVKRTPSKGNDPPVLVPTPLSAKKKSKRSLSQSSVATESSDNELDLTIGDSVFSAARADRSVTSSGSGDKKKTGDQAYPVMSHYSPTRPVSKRTPTPPRASATKRTPLRESGENSLSMRDYSKSSNYFETPDHDNDDDDDDHMESSRIISPSSRFDPFRRSSSVNSKQPLHVNDDDSPLDKVKKFGQNAWGFFSRPVDSLTPCHDDGYKTIPKSLYDTHTSKYSKYSQSSGKYSPNRLSDPDTLKKSSGSFDVSGAILYVLVGFFALLGGAYYLSANPKSIEKGFGLVRDSVTNMLNFLYTFAILPILVAATVGGCIFIVCQFAKQREKSKEERKKQRIHLIERITDIIRDAQDEGIAEPHVRDLLMPPTKRSDEDWKLWGEAANFINNEDSRVRTEVRLVNGIECNVWVWVPMTKQKWQGSAVAEGSPSSNVPSTALSRCIKLRGLQFSDRVNEKIELRRDLRNKLADIDPVHVEFVSGQESVVYMMFKNLSDSKKAFVAFHSNWFNGCLLTAKYVPDNRYIERFPDAHRHLN